MKNCTNRDEEFRWIQKLYRNRCLQTHPDKGGTATDFRRVTAAFALLKQIYQKHKTTKEEEEEEKDNPTQASRNSRSWRFYHAINKNNGSDSESESDNESYDNPTNDDENDDDDDDVFDMAAFYAKYERAFANAPLPSWELYQRADDNEEDDDGDGDDLALYRVECAKSNRSRCVAYYDASRTGQNKVNRCNGIPTTTTTKTTMDGAVQVKPNVMTGSVQNIIEKGEVRVGTLNEQSGGYSRFVHLRCWKVPVMIWLGLPEPPKPNPSTTPNHNRSTLFHPRTLYASHSAKNALGSVDNPIEIFDDDDNGNDDEPDDKDTVNADTKETTTTPTAATTDELFRLALVQMEDLLILSGFSNLPPAQQVLVIRHCQNHIENWSKPRTRQERKWIQAKTKSKTKDQAKGKKQQHKDTVKIQKKNQPKKECEEEERAEGLQTMASTVTAAAAATVTPDPAPSSSSSFVATVVIKTKKEEDEDDHDKDDKDEVKDSAVIPISVPSSSSTVLTSTVPIKPDPSYCSSTFAAAAAATATVKDEEEKTIHPCNTDATTNTTIFIPDTVTTMFPSMTDSHNDDEDSMALTSSTAPSNLALVPSSSNDGSALVEHSQKFVVRIRSEE